MSAAPRKHVSFQTPSTTDTSRSGPQQHGSVPPKSILKKTLGADEPCIIGTLNPSSSVTNSGSGHSMIAHVPARSFLQDHRRLHHSAHDKMIQKLRGSDKPGSPYVELDGMLLYREKLDAGGRHLFSIRRDVAPSLRSCVLKLREYKATLEAEASFFQDSYKVVVDHQTVHYNWTENCLYAVCPAGPATTCELLASFASIPDNLKPSPEMILEKIKVWKTGTHGFFSWRDSSHTTYCYLRSPDLSFSPQWIIRWSRQESYYAITVPRDVLESFLTDFCAKRGSPSSQRKWTWTDSPSGNVLQIESAPEKFVKSMITAVVVGMAKEWPNVPAPRSSLSGQRTHPPAGF